MQQSLKPEKLSNDSYVKNVNVRNSSTNENNGFLLKFYDENILSQNSDDIANVSPESSLSDYRYNCGLNESQVINPNNINMNGANTLTQTDDSRCDFPFSSNDQVYLTNSQTPITNGNIPVSTNGYNNYSQNLFFTTQNSVPNIMPLQQILQFQDGNYPIKTEAKSDTVLKPEDNISKCTDDESIRRIERKRERNREAARKCRERKIHHIEELETNLREKENSYQMLKKKMKLAVTEMLKLSDFISIHIPNSGMTNATEFIKENEIDKILEERFE